MEAGENSKKMWVENMYWTQFQTVRFGVLLSGDFTSQLLIPKKFSEKVRKRLPEKVSLRGPAGDSHNWEVQLSTNNNTTFFVGETWKDFVTTYGLKENDFLVFKYKYNSYFKVTMLDAESYWVEKESSYFVMKSDAPRTDHAEKNQQEKVAESKERTSPQVLSDSNEESDQFLKVGDSRQRVLHCNMSRKVAEDSSDEEVDVVVKRKNDDPHWTLAKKSREEHHKIRNTTESIRTPTRNDNFEWSTDVFKPRQDSSFNHSSRKQAIPRRRSPSVSYNHLTQKLGISGMKKREPTDWEKQRAKQLANQELTEESFLMVMTPSHVGKSFRLALPRGWTAKFMSGCNQDVMLRLYGQGSKEWRIRYYFDKKKCMAQFRTGWNYFARDNALHEFDVCVFKLAGRKEGKVCLDVKIIRAIDEEVDHPLVIDKMSSQGQE